MGIGICNSPFLPEWRGKECQCVTCQPVGYCVEDPCEDCTGPVDGCEPPDDDDDANVWFDLERHNSYEIDGSVTGPDGTPCPPMDCVRVALGEKVKIYRSLKRDTIHACIRGRAVEWDKCFGLFCGSDFDTDNYDFVGTFLVAR